MRKKPRNFYVLLKGLGLPVLMQITDYAVRKLLGLQYSFLVQQKSMI